MIRITWQRGKFFLATFLILLTLISSACGPSGYVDPITKFQSASTVVVTSTRQYLSELNKVQRDHYVHKQVSKRAQISLPDLENVEVFSKEGLKARLDALDQLLSYSDLLLKLANSDAPSKISTQATNLSESLKKLSSTVSGFTAASDTAFKNAVEPVSKIVGQILSFVIQQKIEKALNEAIQNGESPVNNLIAIIGNDIRVAFQLKRSADSDSRTSLVDDYNIEMSKGKDADPDKLKIYADKIISYEDQWENLAVANPASGLDGMAKAHTALVKYAKSDHKITDLTTLVDAMETFAAQAQSLGKAVQSLKSA